MSAPMPTSQGQPQFPPGVKVRRGRSVTSGAELAPGTIVAEPSWQRAVTFCRPECLSATANTADG